MTNLTNNNSIILTCIITSTIVRDEWVGNDNVTYVVLRDELTLRVLGETSEGQKILAFDAHAHWLALDYVDDGHIELVQVKTTLNNNTMENTMTKATHLCNNSIVACSASEAYEADIAGYQDGIAGYQDDYEYIMENNMDNTMTFAQLLVTMIDSNSIEESVAMHIYKTIEETSKELRSERLEELLIAYHDSDLVGEDCAMQLLAAPMSLVV